jgi:hypothetical protein
MFYLIQYAKYCYFLISFFEYKKKMFIQHPNKLLSIILCSTLVNLYLLVILYGELLLKREAIWVSLYVIPHELAEGSSKCFKFHYLVSQSILLDTYFLFLPKKIFVSICGVLIFLWLDFYVLRHLLKVIKCSFFLNIIFFVFFFVIFRIFTVF